MRVIAKRRSLQKKEQRHETNHFTKGLKAISTLEMSESCLVRTITSKVMVAISYNLVKLLILMGRRVAHTTRGSMSKVKVTLKG